MKKRFRKVLSEKCKDFGLTEKAIDDLVDLGSADLKEDSTDEEIAVKADSLVPYAKAMQGEITRKTQKTKPSAKQSAEEEDDDSGEGNGEGVKKQSWYKDFKDRLEALETENKNLKAEKEALNRSSLIAEKAKKLGIPDFLLKGRSFDENADIDKELTEFKQQLVNFNLMPKGQTHESATSKEQMTTEEDAWAQSLPDKH